MQTTPVGKTANYPRTITNHSSRKNRHRDKSQQLEEKIKHMCKNTFDKGKTKVAPPEYSDATTAQAEHPEQGKQKKISFKIAF